MARCIRLYPIIKHHSSTHEVSHALIAFATLGWSKSMKSSQTLVRFRGPDQLSYDNHLFLEGLHPLPASMKTFYNKVPSAEGNIFEACTIEWIPFKRALLEGLPDAASILDGKTTSHILLEILSKATDKMDAAKSVESSSIGLTG